MKTRKVVLEIPADQRLGQAIMNAYRERWFNHVDDWPVSGHNYWNIWEEDTEDIQEALTPKQ